MRRFDDFHSFNGKNIPHINITDDLSIADLIKIFSNSGFNARQLGHAAEIYGQMIREDVTICLTVAGAMTPVGFGGIIRTLIEKGFVDWIITTGANIYHEDHFASGLPIKQGHFDVDDNILYQKQIVRIRDVFVKYYQTLEIEDQILQKMFEAKFTDESFTTPEMVNFLGKISKSNAPFPEKSFLTAAYDYDVPVFISTLKDSSLALNMGIHRLKNKIYKLDIVREVLEQASIIYNSKKSGALEMGGGVPKNMIEQTSQLLNQLLKSKQYGLDYVIQITDARYETGSYSGAELKTAKSWRKVKPQGKLATVYCDSTIAFPLIALYALATQKPRKHKKLYKNLSSTYASFCKNFQSRAA
ncbi:MAG: deoxyhypusine synthase family protein [Nitrososphaerota archaeon]